ncbi:hypothetical protein AVEN_195250-1 [Araneus ventricosus]|uniref:DUF4817 domain-containing protein n=1 Tax=Araneus ventricosus TaxID=182803 RepID=A0A4Y2P5B4_ARAVE|nr:hypothetical protein AVEN_195250-1 [Araneus ventricosus]
MEAMQEKSFCVLEYAKCSSVTNVQRAFLLKYGKAAPVHQSILYWLRQFCETGPLCKGKNTGRPRVSEEIVERMRQSFVRDLHSLECSELIDREKFKNAIIIYETKSSD